MSFDESDLWDDDEPAELHDEDDQTTSLPCPACGEEVYEEAEFCPYCGEFIIRSNVPWQGKPVWWQALGMAGLLAFVLISVLGAVLLRGC